MRRKASLSKSIMIGFTAGFVGAWAMNGFFALQSRIAGDTNGDDQQQQQAQRENDNPTVKVADAIVSSVGAGPLDDEQKEFAGQAVHYVFGGLMGALYAVMVRLVPPARIGFGTAYATALWVGADEVMVPALKLSPPPTESPVSQHLAGLGAHLSYGLALEATRRLLHAAK